MENTIEFVTPEHQHKVVMRAWISFAEKRKLHEFYVEAMPKGESDVVKQNTYMNATTDEATKLVLISIDGKTTDVFEEFKKMHNRDGNEVVRHVNEVIADTKKEPTAPKI